MSSEHFDEAMRIIDKANAEDNSDYGFNDAVRRYGALSVQECDSKENPGLYRVWCRPGQRYRKAVMPSSEVCMHMRIADKPMDFELIEANPRRPMDESVRYMVQLYQPDTDVKFSAPITYGEAGVYYEEQRRGSLRLTGYYFYPNFPAAGTI